jgi:hypothetical protein
MELPWGEEKEWRWPEPKGPVTGQVEEGRRKKDDDVEGGEKF